jgi:hypothetical protein
MICFTDLKLIVFTGHRIDLPRYQKQYTNNFSFIGFVALGDLMVIVLAIGPKVAGSDPV